jgi:hypothetical protein
LFLCAAAAWAAGVTPVVAQSIPSPYAFVEERQEAAAFAGYVSATTGRFGFGPKGGPMYGVRYGVDLTGPISFEGGVGVLDGTRDVVSPSRPEGDRVIGESDVLLTMIDVRLRLTATGARTWHGLSPFLLVGGGVAFDPAKPSVADALLEPDEVFEFGTKFIGVVGPGVRWSLNRHLAVRVDAALHIWQLKTPEGFGDPLLALENVAESYWASGKSVSAAIHFRW